MVIDVSISGIDIAIIALYFIVVLAIGLWVARKTETGEDLFLAGRSLTWGVIGFSLFASNISSTTLIGLSGAAYSTGIAVSNYEWMAAVVLVFMAAVFIPIYIKSRITTVPEFLQLRFDRRSRLYFSAITIVLSIVVDTAGGLYAGALVLKVFWPDLVIWQTCIVLAVIAGLYTAAGGLKAVVYTDVIQAVVLIIGTTLMTLLVFAQFDFSWEAATRGLPEGHLSLIRPWDDPGLPWFGTLTTVPLLGFWYWATNQYITQRVLGAKTITHAQWGAVLGGGLKLLPLFIMVLVGAMAVNLLPARLDNPDMVFPVLVTQYLPVGMIGLVLAGLIAAIMSSVDSTLNSGSTLIVHDFIEPNHPELTPQKVGFYGRVTTVILMVIAAVWAPFIAEMGGLFAYLQQAFAFIVPPVATVFLLGVFWRRGTGAGAFMALVGGHAVGLIIFVLRQTGFITMHFTYTAFILFLISCAIFVMVSRRTPPEPEEKIRGLIWRPEMAVPEEKLPFYKDYRYQSVLVLVLTLWMLIVFW